VSRIKRFKSKRELLKHWLTKIKLRDRDNTKLSWQKESYKINATAQAMQHLLRRRSPKA
jgi:hypothetical protein